MITILPRQVAIKCNGFLAQPIYISPPPSTKPTHTNCQKDNHLNPTHTKISVWANIDPNVNSHANFIAVGFRT